MPKRQVFVLAAVLAIAPASVASASVLQHHPSVTTQAVASHPATTGQFLTPAAARHSDPPGPGPCGFVKAVPFDRFQGLPNYTPSHAARPYLAFLHTSQGLIVFQALTKQAPCTTYSFRFLAQRHYFDQTHCHRLTTRGIFVLQCGDPTGTGSGGPGYRFNDENLTGATYPAGTVAMANAGPNTNGSQFFFCWKDTTLAPNYTPFARVVAGMNVLQKIAAAGDDSQNGPGDGYPHLFTQFNHIRIVFTKVGM
ncbi:MAG TPA: peptidylprolyl isomerase [Streptosporangiaceae bacterium]|nr:peptidylprolyl isomerase [Streptosporangiaceae bacterium]